MTTNKEGIMYAFDSFGLGYKIGTMISITLTFIPSVLSTLETIMDAQRSRGFAWDKGGIIKRARESRDSRCRWFHTQLAKC